MAGGQALIATAATGVGLAVAVVGAAVLATVLTVQHFKNKAKKIAHLIDLREGLVETYDGMSNATDPRKISHQVRNTQRHPTRPRRDAGNATTNDQQEQW